jgi:hypothetical protein
LAVSQHIVVSTISEINHNFKQGAPSWGIAAYLRSLPSPRVKRALGWEWLAGGMAVSLRRRCTELIVIEVGNWRVGVPKFLSREPIPTLSTEYGEASAPSFMQNALKWRSHSTTLVTPRKGQSMSYREGE